MLTPDNLNNTLYKKNDHDLTRIVKHTPGQLYIKKMAGHALAEIQHLCKIRYMCEDAQISFYECKANRLELSKSIMETMKL